MEYPALKFLELNDTLAHSPERVNWAAHWELNLSGSSVSTGNFDRADDSGQVPDHLWRRFLTRGCLTESGICSYFVRMTESVKTFGEAADRGMIIRVECGCGRSEYFIAKDLARYWGRERPVLRHRFKCRECLPPTVTVTALAIDLDRKPSGHIMRLKAGGRYGDPEWRREKFRG